jgi:hypothetical protein
MYELAITSGLNKDADLRQNRHHAGHDQQHGHAGERESARALKRHHPLHSFAATHLKPMAYTHNRGVR